MRSVSLHGSHSPGLTWRGHARSPRSASGQPFHPDARAGHGSSGGLEGGLKGSPAPFPPGARERDFTQKGKSHADRGRVPENRANPMVAPMMRGGAAYSCGHSRSPSGAADGRNYMSERRAYRAGTRRSDRALPRRATALGAPLAVPLPSGRRRAGVTRACRPYCFFKSMMGAGGVVSGETKMTASPLRIATALIGAESVPSGSSMTIGDGSATSTAVASP